MYWKCRLVGIYRRIGIGPLVLFRSIFLGVNHWLEIEAWTNVVSMFSSSWDRGLFQKPTAILSWLNLNRPISAIIWWIACCRYLTLSLTRSRVRSLSPPMLPVYFALLVVANDPESLLSESDHKVIFVEGEVTFAFVDWLTDDTKVSKPVSVELGLVVFLSFFFFNLSCEGTNIDHSIASTPR